jgi:CrcB protein
MSTLVAVGLGGAVGAVARWLATDWVRRMLGDGFPWGTLGVNVVGSLALGMTAVWVQGLPASNQTRAFLAIGLLGSFTTFSTFSLETIELVRHGTPLRAGGYVLASIAASLLAVVIGAVLASSLLSGRS